MQLAVLESAAVTIPGIVLEKLARTSTFVCLEVKPGPPNWGLLHCMYGVCVSPPCIFCSLMTAKRASLFQDFMSSGKNNIFP